MSDATCGAGFACADLTTFCRLDELGLEVTGQRLGEANLAVEAVPADPHSAALLQVPDGTPVLLLERLTHLDDGRPVDLEYIRMRGDRITLRGNLVRGI